MFLGLGFCIWKMELLPWLLRPLLGATLHAPLCGRVTCWWRDLGLVSILLFTAGLRRERIVSHQPEQVGRECSRAGERGREGVTKGCPPPGEFVVAHEVVMIFWKDHHQESRKRLQCLEGPVSHRSVHPVYVPSHHRFLFRRKEVMITAHPPESSWKGVFCTYW